jgi:hypothetical protein
MPGLGPGIQAGPSGQAEGDNSEMDFAMPMIEVTGEPSGIVLRAILEFALDRKMSALLVERPKLGLAASGVQLLQQLKPFTIETSPRSEWPGTCLLDDKASVSRVGLNTHSVGLLLSATDHLYGWRQPALPEDLCLIRADNQPWLASISHEEDCYFQMTEDEKRAFLDEKPEAQIIF